MPTPSLPLAGGCRCGQVRFSISAPPLITMACHCRGCQRMTASAFSLSVLVPSAGFAVTQGEPVIGGLHGSPKHFHCAHCMSWMFTRPDDAPHLVNVRSTLLDDPTGFAPFMQTCVKDRLPWVSLPAAYSFDEFPGMADYPAMLQAYAES
ncbi:GFA family protein [Phenylobacterium aquaticum]|uniref:GFA family protein n=1 Tax=Phenylobacterium aquaticum TaxID=1763816 RepID=UPI0026EFB3AB|nr:GFA family protein [Phenylobacterium aquaticum]